MKITSISVEDLFYTYTYSIDLNNESLVSIIHAPNGYGKTTVFRLIRDVLDLNVKGLYDIPFKSFSIELSDSTKITITQNEQVEDGEYQYTLPIKIFVSKEGLQIPTLVLQRSKLLPIFEESRGPLYQIERAFSEIIHNNNKLISEFERIRKSLEVNFIETSRLYIQLYSDRQYSIIEFENRNTISRNELVRKNPRAGIEANERIVHCAYCLRNLINKVKQQYSTISEEIDRSFPNRLVAAVNDKSRHDHYTNEEIKKKLVELEDKRKELRKTGFISSDQSESLPSIKDSDETLLIFYTLYIDDTFQKLNHYDDIKRKIELFLEIINNKTSFSNKEMSISSEGRVFFKPKGKSTRPDREIALDSLSSGEKHDFILFYELIFNSNENKVFLIDEPEISLHVAWQVEYIKIIEEICKMNDMQAIIATHSPDIVNGRNDLLISLGIEDEDEE